jgi:hypothetical protein
MGSLLLRLEEDLWGNEAELESKAESEHPLVEPEVVI